MNNIKPFITLDDFGISPLANETMLALISRGGISRISVMVHGKISPEEAAKLLQTNVALDIHLDLENHIKKDRKLSGDFFSRSFSFIFNFLFGKTRPQKILALWEKQIQEFKNIFGKYPDGVNSHEHVHFFPFYFNGLLKLCDKYNIKYIRLGKNFTGNFNLIALVLNLFRLVNKSLLLKKPEINSSDLVLSSDWFSDFDFENYLKKMEDKLKSSKKKQANFQTAEIIFHPERKAEFIFLTELAKIKKSSK